MFIEALEDRQMFSTTIAAATDPKPTSTQPVQTEIHVTKITDCASSLSLLLLACSNSPHTAA